MPVGGGQNIFRQFLCVASRREFRAKKLSAFERAHRKIRERKRAVRWCSAKESWHHVLFIECRCARSTYTNANRMPYAVRGVRAKYLIIIMHSTRDNATIKMVLNNNCLIKMLIKLLFPPFCHPFIHLFALLLAPPTQSRRRPKRFIAKCEFHCVALCMRTLNVHSIHSFLVSATAIPPRHIVVVHLAVRSFRTKT